MQQNRLFACALLSASKGSRVEGKTSEGLAAGILPRRALEGFLYMVFYIVT